MEARSVITGLMALAFIASHNLYLFSIKNRLLSTLDQREWYTAELLIFIIPLILMGNSNVKTEREIQFRSIAWFAVSLIMAAIVLNRYNLIPMPHLQVYYFNGITFVYTLYALLFSDKQGNL